MLPNQESSATIPAASEGVRVPVPLLLPVDSSDVSDSIRNICFHLQCAALRIYIYISMGHSNIRMMKFKAIESFQQTNNRET